MTMSLTLMKVALINILLLILELIFDKVNIEVGGIFRSCKEDFKEAIQNVSIHTRKNSQIFQK